MLKNWCFWTVVLEKTLESPLDCKEIQPVHPKGNQLWILIGRTDAEAETPILWPPDAKSQLTGKKSWCWERLKAKEENGRGWNDLIASLTQWTWVWANSGREWRTGKPGVMQSMGPSKSHTQLSDWTVTTMNTVVFGGTCTHACHLLWKHQQNETERHLEIKPDI